MLTSEIRSRIERELKQEAQAVLSRVGLSISDAIRLFLRQVVVAKGLPFEVREVPNAATQAAMLEARQVKKKKRSHKASGNRALTPI